MRVILNLALAAGLFVVATADVGSAAERKPRAQHWAIGCTNTVCVVVRDDGELRFIDMNAIGNEPTMAKLPERPVPPVNVACDHDPVKVTETCIIIDGIGRAWVGPPRAPSTFHRIPFQTFK